LVIPPLRSDCQQIHIRATNRGVELLAIWRLSQFLAGSYTRVRSRDDEGVVPLAPRHGAGCTINAARIAF